MSYFFVCLFVILNAFISISIAKSLKLYDIPNEKKNHKNKILLFGGMFIFLNIFFFLIYLIITTNNNSFSTKNFLNILFLNIIIFFLIGLLDDIKNLKANSKIFIILPILILNFFFFEDLRVNRISFFSLIYEFNFFTSFLFTIFCIFIFINAFNMFDGINGQSGIYSLFFLTYLLFKGINININIFIIIIISSFLIFNLKNVTFLGNSGNLVVGFLLSAQSIFSYNTDMITQEEILILMFLPGIDLTRLFFTRVFNGNHPMVGDFNHIQHLLIKKFNLFYTNLYLFLIYLSPIVVLVYTKSEFLSILSGFTVYVSVIYFLKKN